MGIKEALEKKKREKEIKAKVDTAKKVAAGAAVGAAVGAAAGVLLAPKSGEELRDNIATGAKDAVSKVSDAAKEAAVNIKGSIETAKDKIASKTAGCCEDELCDDCCEEDICEHDDTCCEDEECYEREEKEE